MDNLKRLVSIIMCADVVGYTSMMQQDEQKALSKIKRFEDTLKLETKKYEGEIIKTYGDGCLVLFPSAVNAIYCAINIQRSLRDDPKVPLRIGIHIGEIVRKDHDIFGNGVNVTSRIESMGVAHSVLISSDVFTQIQNHPDIQAQGLGRFNFKNVEGDMDLYAVTNDELIVPLLKDMKGKGKINKGKTLLTGWKMKVMFIFIALFSVSVIIYKLSNTDGQSRATKLSPNITAVDFYLKGELHHKKETLSEIDTAISYYKRAIDVDPNFANAYSRLGSAYMRKYLSFDPNPKWEEEAYSAAEKALIKNPDLGNPYIIRGQFYWSQSHNFAHEDAIYEFLKAIEKEPELSEAYEQLALVQLHIGLFDEALINAQKSIQLNPGNFRARRFMGEALLFQGNYESSLKEFEKIPQYFAPQLTPSLKALIHYYLNQPEKAIDLINESLKNSPNNPTTNSVYAIINASLGQTVEAEQKKEIALENSKDLLHTHHIYYHLGIASCLLNNKQEAVEWLIKAAETGFPNYPLFKSDPNFSVLKGHAEFEELLKNLKEKWEHFKTL